MGTMCRGKRRYRDDIAAKFALSQTQWRDGSRRDKTEKRAYRCPACKGWHLTSQPQRTTPRTWYKG